MVRWNQSGKDGIEDYRVGVDIMMMMMREENTRLEGQSWEGQDGNGYDELIRRNPDFGLAPQL